MTSPRASTAPVPATLSRPRVVFAILALALGGFGIGVTEFVAMGLLPEIAQNLLPAAWGTSHADATASAGHLVSAYALGVVVGAPTIAALGARLPRKRLLLILLAAFTVTTIASAVLPSFGLVLVARFAAGLPHGAYFGIASLVAGSILGPGRRGRGVSLVLAGLTVSNVIGVPVVTYVGQTSGWRAAYLVVAAVFAVTFVAVLVAVPHQPADAGASMRRELAAFRSSQLWLNIASGAIGFGGFFAVYSYVSPIVTGPAGLPSGAVPFALATVGVGMTFGNLLGGWAADRSRDGAVVVFGALLAISLVLVGLLGGSPVGLFGGLFLLGGSAMGFAPIVQTRLMHAAGDAEAIGAAANHSALNIGNAFGAYLGGLAITSGFGYLSSAWVGLVLLIAGMAIMTVSIVRERRGLARPVRLAAENA